MKKFLFFLFTFSIVLFAQNEHNSVKDAAEPILKQLSNWKDVSFEQLSINLDNNKKQNLADPLLNNNPALYNMYSSILQVGVSNSALVNQDGADNELGLIQAGINNNFSLNQYGTNLSNFHMQVGMNNDMELQYLGNNRDITVHQFGNNLRYVEIENKPGLPAIQITQRGNNSQIIVK